VQASIEPESVQDYGFATPEGTAHLSDLFGDKRDLIVILNMGAACPYCTLWADGYNGRYPHISNRAAFVVSSPDTPQCSNASRLAAAGAFRWRATPAMPASAGVSVAFQIRVRRCYELFILLCRSAA
jgi:predicted dithiol-disulfide oxidoreductase (DUF899 family)